RGRRAPPIGAMAARGTKTTAAWLKSVCVGRPKIVSNTASFPSPAVHRNTSVRPAAVQVALDPTPVYMRVRPERFRRRANTLHLPGPEALVNEISAKCGVIVIEGPQQRIDIPLRITDTGFEDAGNVIEHDSPLGTLRRHQR